LPCIAGLPLKCQQVMRRGCNLRIHTHAP